MLNKADKSLTNCRLLNTSAFYDAALQPISSIEHVT